MPSVVVPNQGLLELATVMLSVGDGPFSYIVDLYANNYGPNAFSTPADFVVCTFPGYVPITVDRSLMNMSLEEGNFVQSSYANNPIGWGNAWNSTTTVYGYLVRSTATGNVLWAQAFDVPYVLESGKHIFLTLELQVYPFINYTPPN